MHGSIASGDCHRLEKIDEGKYIRINTEMTYETVMRTRPVGFPPPFLSFENPRNMLDWKVA